MGEQNKDSLKTAMRDITVFKRSIENMIATSNGAYKNSSYYYSSFESSKKYSKKEVLDIISQGTISQQQKLSNDFFNTNGLYKRIILYNATMPKYTGVLIPSVNGGNKKITDEGFQKKYNKALDFIDRLKCPSMLTDFSTKALINGCYYGLILDITQEDISVLDLPSGYCCSRYKNSQGQDLIEFNLAYFNTIIDKEQRDLALSIYPKELRVAFKKFDKGKLSKWYLIPSSMGICFPLFDGRPPFLSVIPSIMDYEEHVELEKKRDEDEIKKVLVQKVPHLNDGKLLFEPDEAEEMHAGAVGMMKGNPNISVLTTYADVTMESSQTANETSRNNIEKMLKTVYEKAGISAELFAATGNLTLEKSIKNDLSFMMYLCNKYSNFITILVNKIHGNSQLKFKYKILPISYYNDTEYINNTHKLASSGYSFILPALAADLSQKDLVDIKDLEAALKLRDKLIPLSTSYTETSESVGAPKKSDEAKSDKTLKNEESIDNGGDGN